MLLSEVVNDQVRQMFQAEANLMAQLSAHPSILTVYQASVSSDGRPYLVMEMCSSALAERYRRERVPVAEVMRIAVQIGSAVETAHRAGVLHRDIKPSNILLTAYGHPVLSDFGIAATLSDASTHEAVGMSIPWSAPEVLMDETPGSVASEVWALAATVYSLLAGRSPFEIPGHPNKSVALISRINRAKIQPIGRADVPVSLERLLQHAMSRRPESRPASAMELVREFQAVETELGVPQTPVEVAMDDWALATVSDLEERTHIRGIATPGTLARSRRRRRRATGQQADYAPVGTLLRDSSPLVPHSGTVPALTSRGMRALSWALVAGLVLAIALGAMATMVLVNANASEIATVSDITAELTTDSVQFSWPDPGLKPGDQYQIATRDGQTSIQQTRSFTVDAKAGDRVCITVTVNRDGKTGPPSSEKCADFVSR